MLQARSWLPRTEGSVRLGFARRGERPRSPSCTRPAPRACAFPSRPTGAPPEAVLLNTAGGLTGGDRIDVDGDAGRRRRGDRHHGGGREDLSRPRRRGRRSRVKLALGAGARLAWLPQPTILFDRSRLDRRTEVELAGDARLPRRRDPDLRPRGHGRGRARAAPAATPGASAATARWCSPIPSASTAPIADALDRPATLDGARAVGHAPLRRARRGEPASTRRARCWRVRQAIAGASAWNGLLLVRAMARDGRTLQQATSPPLVADG